MISLGTNFDGIIDPLNSFWTAEQLPFLADFLERHVHNYVSAKPYKNSFNNLDADEIIDRVFSSNAHSFFRKWYK